MRNTLFFLIMLTSACASSAQQATPSPTPVELKLEKLAKITSVTSSLRRIAVSDPKFEAEDDRFRIQLPPESVTYSPAKWPKSAG